ncbi:hypothetical protein GQ55_1G195000 [Panicum hallii var. hallii]|uniref:Uncharacterized protein n=1 Tax=Panicum hallii var. hallii TaxID=1504633 RepID=A0A2T7F6A6_9POAL|nr:hypothetical protein GQ55_1G195000 [Panicum hallii var. hallii]
MDDHTVDLCAKSKRISFIALNSFLLQLLLPLECYQILCKKRSHIFNPLRSKKSSLLLLIKRGIKGISTD